MIKGRVHRLEHQSGNRYQLSDKNPRSVLDAWGRQGNYHMLNQRRHDSQQAKRTEASFRMMAAESLQLPVLQSHQNKKAPLPVLGEAGTHFFLALPAPESCRIQNPDLIKRQATILYHLDLPVLESQHD